MVTIHQLIAAIVPDIYCDPATRRQVKQILNAGKAQQDAHALLAAAGKAQVVEPNTTKIEDLELESPFRLPAFRSPVERHTLVHDSLDDSLEAFYFWLLDELQRDDWNVSKLTDTFLATPGSGLDSDLARRATQAQQQAQRLMEKAQTLVRDIFRAAEALTNERRTAEEAPDSERSPDHEPAHAEIQRHLLKSKIQTLKLYARWLGPYLRQARQMEPKARESAGLVSLFNTAALELTLLAQREDRVQEEVDRDELPRMFRRANHRPYFAALVLDLAFRTAPERTSPGAYGHRGRFEVTLTSYALNQEEISLLRQELDQDDLEELINVLASDSGKTLTSILQHVEALVLDKTKPEPELTPADPNPFLALFGVEDKRPPLESPDETTHVPWWSVKPDTDLEAVIRSQAILDARRRCLEFYNRCKAARGMAWIEPPSKG